MQNSVSKGNADRIAPRRLGLLVEGRQVPVVPQYQLLSSVSHEWQGLLVEHHLAELNNEEIPKHSHSGIGLSMQLNGSLRLQWKSGSGWQSAATGAGSILLHGSSGCNESIWNGRYDRIMCQVIPTHLAKLTEGRFAGAVVDVADRWSFKDARLEHLLRVLHVELQQGAPTGPLFGEQVGDAIAMLLAKQYATVKVGVWGTGGSIPPPRLKQVLDYIEAHLDQQTHLTEIAQAASMSPFYFARLFKNSMGVSPHKYVTMRRIERSKELLRRSDISIFEIGVRVGYLETPNISESCSAARLASPRVSFEPQSPDRVDVLRVSAIALRQATHPSSSGRTVGYSDFETPPFLKRRFARHSPNILTCQFRWERNGLQLLWSCAPSSR